MRNAPSPSPTRDKIQAWLDQQSWIKLQLPERRDRSDLAYYGFQVLGSNAIPAVPELTRMLARRINPPAVAACLQVIGPAAYPALAQGLTNSDAEVQHVALFNLLDVARRLGPTVSLAVIGAITNGIVPLNDLEVRYLGDSGPVLRGLTPWLESVMYTPTNPLAGTAMRLITFSSENPAAYVPFFNERLTNAASAPDAAFALARVGPKGIPTLLQALTNPNPRISGAALAALHPELKTARPGASLQSLSMSFDSRFGMWTERARSSLRPKLKALSTSLELAGLLDHLGVPVRLQIVQLLERCGVYGAPGLSRAAEDPEEMVRSAAQAALERLDIEVRDGAIIRGPCDQRQVALVFIGHEHGDGGQAILDELAQHRAQASFFLTTNFLNQPAFRPLVKRICSEGHYLGPHAGGDVLSSAQEQPTAPDALAEQFESEFSSNLNGVRQWFQSTELPGYFLPPYERCNYELLQWAGSYFYITINPTPGISSKADMAAGAEPNAASWQPILDRIIAWEQQDPHGLNGCILSFDLGSRSGGADNFPSRFGQLLDVLAAKGYRFVAVDALFDAQTAGEERRRRVVLPQPVEVDEALRKRYGLTK